MEALLGSNKAGLWRMGRWEKGVPRGTKGVTEAGGGRKASPRGVT